MQLGGLDSAQLLTSVDLGGSTIGLGYIGTLCTTAGSAAISMAHSSSLLMTATTVAHEIGHNFGMSHDAASGDYLMTPATASLSEATHSQWSEASKASASTFFEVYYGATSMYPRCAENEVAGYDAEWDFAVCGDGIVDFGETCDVGTFATDEDNACCGAPGAADACELLAGCECASGACCERGVLTARGVVCRAAAHAACDVEERCTGSSGECPTDLVVSPGAQCADVASTGVAAAGACFAGDCVSKADNCTWSTTYIYPCEHTGCDSAYCAADAEASKCFYLSGATDNSDGVPCDAAHSDDTSDADSYQCMSIGFDTTGDSANTLDIASECVASTRLKTHTWAVADAGCALGGSVKETRRVHQKACSPFREREREKERERGSSSLSWKRTGDIRSARGDRKRARPLAVRSRARGSPSAGVLRRGRRGRRRLELRRDRPLRRRHDAQTDAPIVAPTATGFPDRVRLDRALGCFAPDLRDGHVRRDGRRLRRPLFDPSRSKGSSLYTRTDDDEIRVVVLPLVRERGLWRNERLFQKRKTTAFCENRARALYIVA